MTRFLKFALFVFSVVPLWSSAQVVTMTNGSINACDGTTLQDDGGGGPYTDTDYTLTICPTTPGDVVQLNFAAFNLQTSPNPNNSDYLSVFDGPDVNSPPLGDYTGVQTNLQITGTVNNPTGCLTIRFSANGAANAGSPGFEAQVICTTPCANPVSVSAITNPQPIGLDQSVSVCQNASITFSGVGSAAQPGFTLSRYIWDFADGSVDSTSGAIVSHSFSAPGEYVVVLTVKDDNNCNSLNVIPLQVLVSTTPIFQAIRDMQKDFLTCDSIILNSGITSNCSTFDGPNGVISTTWTALPPQVVSGQTYLADGAGFSYSTSLNFDFFDPGSTLTSCADLTGIFVNMEHSYMGDLGIFVTCPNGTQVNLVTWGTNGGGGCFLGEPVDDFGDPTGNTPGVGYTYTWSPTATNGTWGQNSTQNQHTYTDNAGNTYTNQTYLPAGTYQSQEDMCALVGCPLNGSWTISVTDNLGADNGYIFYWGVSLNPNLYPDVTTFTPCYGTDSDSSYWVGPYIVEQDAGRDVIRIEPPAPGDYNYTYYATNNFGCTFDTTITIHCEDPWAITAGPDQVYSCGQLTLEGGFAGLPTPTCGGSGGSFTYCYPNNDNQVWTYCPDTPGDGTAMRITFNSGSTEFFLDNITIYDGPNTSSPVLASNVTGALAGQTFLATNPGGCLTMTFTSDGSVSCATGAETAWNWVVDCTTGGPDYVWSWDPGLFLSDNSIPNPIVSDLTQSYTYTLTAYPVGHTSCAMTDQVLVTVNPLGNPGVNTTIDICSTDPPFTLLSALNGNPVSTGFWTDPLGQIFTNPLFNPLSDMSGPYTYTVQLGNCSLSAVLTINFPQPLFATIASDTSLCFGEAVGLYPAVIQNGAQPYSYNWTYNAVNVTNSLNSTYTPQQTGTLCLAVTDACNSVVTACRNVEVEQPVLVKFSVDDSTGCWPTPMKLFVQTDTSLFAQSVWTISDGTSFINQDTVSTAFANPGTYDVTLTLISDIGCTYTTTKSQYLIQYQPPVASWSADPNPTNALETTVQFTNESIGDIVANSWLFDVENNTGLSAQVNPSYQYPLGVGGTYTVRLRVLDIHNCTDIVEGPVVINDIFQQFVPTALTPNNDGVNDVLKFVGTDIDETKFKFEVFNRWGDKVYESTDPSAAWIANASSGAYYVPDGVYIWKAVVVSKTTSERKELKGTITIVR